LRRVSKEFMSFLEIEVVFRLQACKKLATAAIAAVNPIHSFIKLYIFLNE